MWRVTDSFRPLEDLLNGFLLFTLETKALRIWLLWSSHSLRTSPPPFPPLEGLILFLAISQDTFSKVDNNGSLGVADVPMGKIQNLRSELSLHVHSLNVPTVWGCWQDEINFISMSRNEAKSQSIHFLEKNCKRTPSYCIFIYLIWI